MALLVAVLGPAPAQDWNFTHDASGNSTARSAAGPGSPQILGQPQPQVVAPGDVATFSVVLGNASGATYQWRFNEAAIGGATSDSLVIPSVVAGNAGLYSVVVSIGPVNVTSANAELLIDSDEDGLPDSWEIANFGNLTRTATGDFDNDGANNLAEYREATDPTSDASRKVGLTISATGGAVSVSPTKASYDLGETVTLTAVPTPPNRFQQWDGALTGTSNPQTLVMSADRNVIARFAYVAVPPGVVAWWRGETDANDFVGGYNGTFHVGGTATGPAVTQSGKVGGAFDFDGTNHIRVADVPALRPDRFTVEAWVYPTVTSSASQMLVARGGPPGVSAWSVFLQNGVVRFYSDQHGFSIYNATVLPLNAWSHVAITFDGLYKGVYVNGSPSVTPLAIPIAYDSAPMPVTLGAILTPSAPADHFTGRLDEVTFYSRALSQAEITAIVNGADRGKSVEAPIFTVDSKLPEATVGEAYSATLTTGVGSGPMNFSLVGGALPEGLTMSEAGVLSGTPLWPATSEFDVAAVGANAIPNQRTFALRVNRRAVPPLGILAWWRGEPDVSGQAIDQIAGRNGSFFQTNTPATALHTAGKVGSAFSIPTPGLHARIADSPELRPAQVTMEAWIYPTWSSSAYRAIIARGSPTSFRDTWYLGTRNGAIDYFSEHTGNGTHLLNSPAIPLYEWTHVAGTFDGSTKALYINGVRVSSALNLGALAYEGSAPVTIGSDWENGPVAPYYGLIDEVTLYNRALGDAEVRGLADAGGSGKSLIGPFSIDLGEIAIHQPVTTRLVFPTGVAPVSFSLLAGEPPPGITLLADGTFSGTSPTSGEFSFTARATDANNAFIDLIPTVRVFRPADRPAGLISWWRAENSLLDSIGANHATPFGSPGYRAGKVGSAFSLSGGSAITVADAPSLRPASLTFEGWVNFSAVQPAVIAGKQLGSGFGNSWAIYHNGGVLYGGYSPSPTTFQNIGAGFNPELGRWYHVAYSYDAVTLQQRLYRDGVRVATGAVSLPLAYDSQPVLLGLDLENATPGYFFQGGIDEAALYDRPLSDREIAAIHAAGIAGKALPQFGDFEDLDGDQLVNLLEYGINTDPGMVNAGPQATTFTDPLGGIHAVMSLVRDPRRSDVMLTVESSGDLIDWVPVSTSAAGRPFTGIATIVGEVVGNAPRTVNIIDPYFGKAGFLRLRISR